MFRHAMDVKSGVLWKGKNPESKGKDNVLPSKGNKHGVVGQNPEGKKGTVSSTVGRICTARFQIPVVARGGGMRGRFLEGRDA